MVFVRRLLLAFIITCPGVVLVGCSPKQTIKSGTEEQAHEKFPPPPGKSGTNSRGLPSK